MKQNIFKGLTKFFIFELKLNISLIININLAYFVIKQKKFQGLKQMSCSSL